MVQFKVISGRKQWWCIGFGGCEGSASGAGKWVWWLQWSCWCWEWWRSGYCWWLWCWCLFLTTITNNPDDGNWCRRCFRGWKVGQTEGLPGPALQSSSSSSSFPHSYCRIFCHRHRNPHNLPCHQHLLCHHLTLIIACTTSPSYIHKTGTQSSQLPLPAIPGCSESINEKKEKCEKEN